MVERAIELAERAVADHGRATSVAVAIEAWRDKAVLTGSYADWTAAIRYAEWLASADPRGIGAWRLYGDVLWESPRRDEAPVAYSQALRNDENFELDPLKQLSARARETLRRRIEQAGQGN
jgi:tetratricopeptide (TPR) repeat protein